MGSHQALQWVPAIQVGIKQPLPCLGICFNEKSQEVSTQMINYKVDQNVIRHRKDKQRNGKEVEVCFMETLSIGPGKEGRKLVDPLGEGIMVLSQSTTALSLAH